RIDRLRARSSEKIGRPDRWRRGQAAGAGRHHADVSLERIGRRRARFDPRAGEQRALLSDPRTAADPEHHERKPGGGKKFGKSDSNVEKHAAVLPRRLPELKSWQPRRSAPATIRIDPAPLRLKFIRNFRVFAQAALACGQPWTRNIQQPQPAI